MLKLLHRYTPTFGNAGDTKYSITFAPFGPEVVAELSETPSTQIKDDRARALVVEALTGVEGLQDTEGKPVTGAEGIAQLVAYRAFVGEVFWAIVRASAVDDVERPT